MTASENTTAPEPTTATPDWSVIDIGSIIVSISGVVFTLLPWGVFQTRLENVDILLMATPVFILVAALLTYATTVLVKKTHGTRNRGIALLARILVWSSVVGLVGVIFFRFLQLLFA